MQPKLVGTWKASTVPLVTSLECDLQGKVFLWLQWHSAGFCFLVEHTQLEFCHRLIHPGLIGTAPSTELLKIWNEREATLVAEEGTEKEKTLW